MRDRGRFTFLRVFGMVVVTILGALTAWVIVGVVREDPKPAPGVVSRILRGETRVPPASAEYDEGVRIGDFAVILTHVRIGKTKIRNPLTGKEYESDSDYVEVGLVLRNLSEVKKVQFTSWSETDDASLNDEHGNDYFSRAPSFPEVAYWGDVEQAFAEQIYPGESATGVLVFERPVDAADELVLTLPSLHFMPDGIIRFSIPRSAVGWDRSESLPSPMPQEPIAEEKWPPPAQASRPPKTQGIDIPAHPTEIPEPRDAAALEKMAQGKLRLADELLERGKRADALRWYETIVKEYPLTEAADEAYQKLEALR